MTQKYSAQSMIIDKRENVSCEFKRTKVDKYLKVADAFANYGTGRILFGVDDDGNAVGLEGDLNKLCLSIENQMNDSIEPRASFTLNPDPELCTITLEVEEGFDKPYFLHGKAYKRSDTSAVEVDRFELRRLYLEGSNQTFDALSSKNQNLSFSTLNTALGSHLQLETVGLDIYKTLGLYDPRLGVGFTNAGAILADTNDFPGVRIVGYGENHSTFNLDEEIKGVSAITQLENSMDLFLKRYREEVIVGVQRVFVERIPKKAFREALANALIHRQWDIQTNINVAFDAQSVEIISPGPLPYEMSKEDYLELRISELRNPLLAEVFHRLGYVELFGTGIRRIIEAYEDTPLQPEFLLTSHHISVTLPVIPLKPVTWDGELSAEERAVLHALYERGNLSRPQVQQVTGLSKAVALRVLGELMSSKKHLVKRFGSSSATRYGLLGSARSFVRDLDL